MSSSTVATNQNIVGEDGPPVDEQMPSLLTLVHLSSALSLSPHAEGVDSPCRWIYAGYMQLALPVERVNFTRDASSRCWQVLGRWIESEDRDLGSETTYYGPRPLCGREKWK